MFCLIFSGLGGVFFVFLYHILQRRGAEVQRFSFIFEGMIETWRELRTLLSQIKKLCVFASLRFFKAIGWILN